MDEQNIINAFYKIYYGNYGRTWNNTFWRGYRMEKNPLDLHIYQEIIHETQPDIIIETGTGWGGSSLFLANMCDLIGKGKVITIDSEIRRDRERPTHNKINYLIGDSVSCSIINTVASYISNNDKVLVILDSCHGKNHVLNELMSYSKLINLRNYIIVEDSLISGHPLGELNGDGPMEAIEEFLKTNLGKNFTIDKNREKFYITSNPNGFLRRIT